MDPSENSANYVAVPSSSTTAAGQQATSDLMAVLTLSEGTASDHAKGNPSDLDSANMTDSDILAGVQQNLGQKYIEERERCLTQFPSWNCEEQMDYVLQLLLRMGHFQHGQVNAFLKPMLQRDFITLLPERGLSHLAGNVLSYLDAKSLCSAELVCRSWRRAVADGMLWKKLIEAKVRTDSLWAGLSEKRGWKQYLFKSKDRLIAGVYNELCQVVPRPQLDNEWSELQMFNYFYRRLYPKIVRDIDMIEDNWRCGKHVLHRINCHSENSKGVYCLQYDDDKIVSGLRDNTIKVWDATTLQCRHVLSGHTGSVLCLQYDDRVIISGSSDSTVRVWDAASGEQHNTLIHHTEAVLHLRFQDGLMVTCSKDRTIAVWDMVSPQEINVRRVLVGHRAAVNVVDFDSTYIVSASGDRTIKVWSTDTCEFVRTLSGHKRGIACLQYRAGLVVSGSSDNTIRLWDIESGQCLRALDGHEELVRCIRFDTKRIVSGAYDGKIKVWDLRAALDPRSPPGTICLKTLSEHTGRVFRLQFDEFQIVSSSHDDTILVWDFLNFKPPSAGSAQAANAAAAPEGGARVRRNAGAVQVPVLLQHADNGAADPGAAADAAPAAAAVGPAALLDDDEQEDVDHGHEQDEEPGAAVQHGLVMPPAPVIFAQPEDGGEMAIDVDEDEAQ